MLDIIKDLHHRLYDNQLINDEEDTALFEIIEQIERSNNNV